MFSGAINMRDVNKIHFKFIISAVEWMHFYYYFGGFHPPTLVALITNLDAYAGVKFEFVDQEMNPVH